MSGKYTDPVTGDDLTRSEWVSWKIQGVIRRWAFVVAIQVATAFVFALGHGNVLVIWNLGASDWAILLESIVGIAVISSGRRDSVILREIQRAVRAAEGAEEQATVAREHASVARAHAAHAVLKADSPENDTLSDPVSAALADEAKRHWITGL